MILPKAYLDKTMGVRHAPNASGFNNVVYSTWYHIGRMRQGTFSYSDLDALTTHLELNNDENGLYKPKNSHDNVTYKMILSKVFSLDYLDKMSFFKAIKEIGIFRIWDVITYGAVFGPKVLRPIFRVLLFIPALQMVHSCYVKGKVRPKWFDSNDPRQSRWKWWFKSKTLVREDQDGSVTYKTWKLKNGERKITIHLQNDGKHLAIFRLFALKNSFFMFRLAAKICRKILISRFGEDYTYQIIKNYFKDKKHPVIAMWKGHGDILK